ncbi:hypothetical protein MMC07_008976 [Pseudocyphellaria aurata]|nr:hypothetical protein [Pseudocyphellaria aurata]
MSRLDSSRMKDYQAVAMDARFAIDAAHTPGSASPTGSPRATSFSRLPSQRIDPSRQLPLDPARRMSRIQSNLSRMGNVEMSGPSAPQLQFPEELRPAPAVRPGLQSTANDSESSSPYTRPRAASAPFANYGSQQVSVWHARRLVRGIIGTAWE